jgi:hypothetical protein
MLNRASFATVSATATRAYVDASAIAISPTPNTQEAYKKLSKDIWNPTDCPVFVLYRFILRSLEPSAEILGLPTRLRDRPRQYDRNPARCQRMIVSGRRIAIAPRTEGNQR